jgi:hypothetical protein
MKRFLIVEDYTDKSIWDHFILVVMLGLKSKPTGWGRKENDLPEGNWMLSYGMHQMATDKAYTDFGVRKPNFKELPTIFVVNPDGSVEEQCNVTSDQAGTFVNSRI